MDRLSLRQLKWVSILIPSVAVGAFEHVRHAYFGGYLHGTVGNFLTMGIDLVGIFIFFQAIFRILEKMQSNLVNRNQELSIINTLVAGASQSLEMEQILDLGLAAALKALARDQGAAWLYEEKTRDLVLRTNRGAPAEGVQSLERLPAFLSAVASDEGPQAIELPSPASEAEEPHRFVLLPLRAKGKLLGTLAVWDRAGEPAPLNRELLVSIAGHVSMAIDNAKLFQETLSRQHRAQALYQLGVEVSTLLDLDRVLESVVDKAQELLGMEPVALALWDDQAQEMVARASRGFRTDPARQTRQPRWRELNRRVLSSGQAVQESYGGDDEDSDSIVRVKGDIAHLAVPLKAGRRVIGVLHRGPSAPPHLSPGGHPASGQPGQPGGHRRGEYGPLWPGPEPGRIRGARPSGQGDAR